ncbi:MAG: metallopeptidase [Patescibacteria group bacterium]|nr:metallopeptidase [Patescibacteria group bacterium]
MDFKLAPDLNREISRLVVGLGFSHVRSENIVCFRSYGSKSRAIARIWSLPKIWQIALEKEAHYCIEVVTERFERLSVEEKEKVLIHELLHIPKNFSGALLPHRQRKKRIDMRTVNKWHDLLKR